MLAKKHEQALSSPTARHTRQQSMVPKNNLQILWQTTLHHLSGSDQPQPCHASIEQSWYNSSCDTSRVQWDEISRDLGCDHSGIRIHNGPSVHGGKCDAHYCVSRTSRQRKDSQVVETFCSRYRLQNNNHGRASFHRWTRWAQALHGALPGAKAKRDNGLLASK